MPQSTLDKLPRDKKTLVVPGFQAIWDLEPVEVLAVLDKEAIVVPREGLKGWKRIPLSAVQLDLDENFKTQHVFDVELPKMVNLDSKKYAKEQEIQPNFRAMWGGHPVLVRWIGELTVVVELTLGEYSGQRQQARRTEVWVEPKLLKFKELQQTVQAQRGRDASKRNRLAVKKIKPEAEKEGEPPLEELLKLEIEDTDLEI